MTIITDIILVLIMSLEIFYGVNIAFKFDLQSSVFHPFLLKDQSIYHEIDSYVNFVQDTSSFHTIYYSYLVVKQIFKNCYDDAVYVVHVNIRNIVMLY